MYHGRRDPEIPIYALAAVCNRYTAQDGHLWIEAAVPPETVAEYNNKWGSIMVETNQVRRADSEVNLIFVNDGAAIVVSVKDDKHRTISSETLTPTEMIGRWLKWVRYPRFCNLPGSRQDLLDNLDCPSIELYHDFSDSHMDILSYTNRLPFYLNFES